MNRTFIRIIKRTKWYRQGGAAVMWYVSPPWSIFTALTTFGKRIPPTFRNMAGHNAGDFFTMYWTVPSMHRVARYYIYKQLSQSSFIKELRTNWDRNIVTPLDGMIADINRAQLRNESNDQLTRRARRFIAQYRLAWSESIFHDAFDLVANELVQREFLNGRNALSQNDVERLLTPNEPLIMQHEQYSLARIAAAARNNRRLSKLMLHNAWKTIAAEYPIFSKRITVHRNAYYWMYNDYEHVVDIPIRVFRNRIRHLATNRIELHKGLSVIDSVKQSARAKSNLIQRLKLTPRQQSLVMLLTTIQVWRDERKAMSQRAHTAMRCFGKECMRRGGLTEKELRCAFYWDWDKVLRPTSAFRSRLRARRKGVVHLVRSTTTKTIAEGVISSAYKELLDGRIRTAELCGMPACAGVVRGKAKIILNQVDFSKFKSGDILITPNTRPEYVPIMKKAAAIITEEGGITSHAAIVSRELKIPAIVGVQGILEAFKNGDRVEVDANTGTVRLLRN